MAGQRIVIACRGEEIAEIRPQNPDARLEKAIAPLEGQGKVGQGRQPTSKLRPLAK